MNASRANIYSESKSDVYEISDLNSGMYLVKVFDTNNNEKTFLSITWVVNPQRYSDTRYTVGGFAWNTHHFGAAHLKKVSGNIQESRDVSYIIILKSIPSNRLQRCWPKIWLFKIIRKSLHRQLKKNKNLSFVLFRETTAPQSLASYRNLITKVDNEPDPIEVNVSPLCPSNNPHCHNWETLLITRGFGSRVFWLLVRII